MKNTQLFVIIGIFATINILGLGTMYFKLNNKAPENQYSNYNSPYLDKSELPNNIEKTNNKANTNTISKDEKYIKNIISIYTDSLINKDFKKAYSLLTDKSKKNISYKDVYDN